MPAGSPGRLPHSGAQTMPASECNCGWAVTMARGPARQQRQLPVQGQPGLRPWLWLCPMGWNQSRASRLRMAGCQGGQCLPKRNGALGWREVEVEMRMGAVSRVLKPQPGLRWCVARVTALLAVPSPQGHKEPLRPPPHPHPLCRASQGAGPWCSRKEAASPSSGMFQAAGQSTRGPLRASPHSLTAWMRLGHRLCLLPMKCGP